MTNARPTAGRVLGSEEVRSRLADLFDAEPVDLTELDGGMIGTVSLAAFADRDPVVAKTGETPLSAEAAMLRALAPHLPVPEVYHATDDLLVLERVSGESTFSPAAERDAAERLADLHAATADAFGFERDTLTGPVRQPNPRTDSWPAFFRDHRVLHAAEGARAAGELPAGLYERVRSAAADFESLLQEPPAPALIHGDVWTTNVLAEDGEVTAFLDPATYYADPEVELAYARWTDTFGEAFFERYEERRGVADGFAERRPVYTLYPLLIHAWLFGERYVDELDRTLAGLGY